MSKPFSEINKKLGFGCMRLPMDGDEVNDAIFCQMIDSFITSGFNYFDTAHGYIGGKSELAIGRCLSARYDRSSFVLANKLTSPYFNCKDDIRPFFEKQLEACCVDYFDFYLIHAVSSGSYPKYRDNEAFSVASELKKEGKIGHIGISFHDSAEFLDKVLTENSCIEFVQLQFNYLDFDDPGVQSKACYDVAVKHGKPVIVMEPVKGGALARLDQESRAVASSIGEGSDASYALRFAASFDNVYMVLSGMGNMDMMTDNIATFTPFIPLSENEIDVLHETRRVIRRVKQVQCTGCEYCMEPCPMEIKIPNVFKAYNAHLSASVTKSEAKAMLPKEGGSPVDCISCGACAAMCPQHLEIPELMQRITKSFGLKNA